MISRRNLKYSITWSLILIVIVGVLIFNRSGHPVESLAGVIQDCLSFGGKGGSIKKAVVLLDNGATVKVMTNSCFNCVGNRVIVQKKYTKLTDSVIYEF